MEKSMRRDTIYPIIEQAIKYPIVSIEANTGMGKTIAMESYLKLEEKDYIILRLSLMDNLPEHFWNTLTSAFQERDQVYSDQMRRLGFPNTMGAFNEYMYILAQKCNRQNEDIYLAIDDFHLIHEESVIYLVENIAYSKLDGHHTVLISSKKPKIHYDKLQKDGLLAMITEEELNFGEKEIVELMYFHGLSQNHELLNKIHTITEGWVYAVDFILLALKQGKGLAMI